MSSRILHGIKFIGKISVILCFVFFTCWCFFTVLFSNLPDRSVRILASIIFLVAIVSLISFSKGSMMIRLMPPMILNLVVLIWWMLIPPRNDRSWSSDQAILPAAELRGNSLQVSNIRNCHYRTTTDYTVQYYDRTFDLDALDSLWFGVEPFADFRGAAHTFLSFGWSDGTFLAVSVEIRKEKGESFSALKGMFKQFELMYVLGDERDLIGLRTNFRRDEVYLYPIKASRQAIQALLLEIVAEVNALEKKPQFYHTLWNTCTTRIVRHVNQISPRKIPWRPEILFPANSDQLAYELGFIDTSLSFEEARKRFHINDKAREFGEAADFSMRIREEPGFLQERSPPPRNPSKP